MVSRTPKVLTLSQQVTYRHNLRSGITERSQPKQGQSSVPHHFTANTTLNQPTCPSPEGLPATGTS